MSVNGVNGVMRRDPAIVIRHMESSRTMILWTTELGTHDIGLIIELLFQSQDISRHAGSEGRTMAYFSETVTPTENAIKSIS